MYGKNGPSDKKLRIVQGLKSGKNFKDLAEELQIAKPTAEVYGIDCLAATRRGLSGNSRIHGHQSRVFCNNPGGNHESA